MQSRRRRCCKAPYTGISRIRFKGTLSADLRRHPRFRTRIQARIRRGAKFRISSAFVGWNLRRRFHRKIASPFLANARVFPCQLPSVESSGHAPPPVGSPAEVPPYESVRHRVARRTDEAINLRGHAVARHFARQDALTYTPSAFEELHGRRCQPSRDFHRALA